MEQKLSKTAEKRGVDKKILAESAPKITFLDKCCRSIYSKPPQKKVKVTYDKEYKA